MNSSSSGNSISTWSFVLLTAILFNAVNDPPPDGSDSGSGSGSGAGGKSSDILLFAFGILITT